MNRISKTLKTALTFFISAYSIFLISSCSKNGELMQQAQVIQLTVTSFSTSDEAVFKVNINDEILSDSLYNRYQASKVVIRKDGKQHLLVKKRSNDSTLIDTLLSITDRVATITLLQLDTTAAPVILGGGSGEVPDQKRMLSFYTNDTIMPAAFGLELYACYSDPNTGELLRVDTLARFDKVTRGELTEFKLVNDSTSENVSIGYFFQPLDLTTGEPFENLLRPFSPPATGPLLTFTKGSLGTEKYYINTITARKLANGKLLLTAPRLLAY